MEGDKCMDSKRIDVMMRILTILLLLPVMLTAQLRTLTQQEFTANLQHNGFYQFLPDGYPEVGVKYPVIIFLHGVGERGNGIPGGTELPRVLNHGIPRLLAAGARMQFTNPVTGLTEKFIVLAPQLPSTQISWTPNWVAPIVDYAKTLQIDTNKIHLTGLSAGGGGALFYALQSQTYANNLASIVLAATICDGPSSGVCNISRANTPLWSLVAQNDFTQGGGASCTNALIAAINACTGNSAPAQKTIYPDGGHAIWDRVYDTTHTWHNPNPYEWMLSKVRGETAGPPPPPPPSSDSLPKANAGPDQTIPVGQATTIHGTASTDLGGTITSYNWQKFSGPSAYEILTPNSVSTWIRNMTAGVYVYRLTITDNRGLTSTDDVQITVTGSNQLPTAIAGNPQTITLPTSSVTLEGSGTDPDGTIASYAWTQVSGTAATITTPSAATTTVTGLSTAGVRVFRLTVTDNQGGTGTATVTITVQASTATMDRIPMDYKRFYALVNNTYDARRLFDTATDVKYTPGAGLVYANTGGFEARYQFADEMDVTLKKLRWFDDKYEYSSKPIKIYVITDHETMDTVYIGSFTGRTYENWDSLVLPTPIEHVKYLVFRGGQWDNWMNELQAYGEYDAHTDVVPPLVGGTLRDQIGMNIYEWNFVQNKIYTFVGWEMYEPNWDVLKWIPNYRHYVDWKQIEWAEQKYSFNPTSRGAWNYDAMYQRASAAGHSITPCIKAVPEWIMAYLPSDVTINRRDEVRPLKYPDSPDSLASYIAIAHTYFQFAARYGQTAVPLSKIKVQSPPNFTAQTKKTGLGYVKWMEADNELDAWWKGGSDGNNYGYMNGRQYAAFLSMVYDGHMGRYGDTLGIKYADPLMKLTLGGTANPEPDYVRGILDWCKEFRNDSLPFDWSCFHEYATGGPASQVFQSNTVGVAPEVSKLPAGADEQLFALQVFANKNRSYKRGVINSEYGYDTDPTSPLFAEPHKTKNTFHVQGDYILRTMLMYWEKGFSRNFYFQLYDNAEGSPGVFGTSGILYSDYRKRPAYDFIEQIQKALGNVDSFDVRLSTEPRVMRAKNGSARKYIGWTPYQIDTSIVYTYTLSNPSNRVKIYTLTPGQSDAYVTFAPAGATANITLTGTPTVWEEVASVYSFVAPTVNAGPDQVITLPLANAQTPIVLQGTGSDNADTVRYQWRKVSGPAGNVFIETPYRSRTNVYRITNGTYVFELMAIDGDGRTNTDQVTVTVNNAPGNAAPIARAGNDTTIVAPTTHYFLNGAASTDDIGIVTYSWRKISGPSWGTISQGWLPQTYVYIMDPGNVYQFELIVTDAKGSSSADTVQVTILKSTGVPPVNGNPIADAGEDQIITLPVNSVQLNGTASSDADGTINSYLWEKILGPETYSISNPNSPTPILTNLVEGVYQFQLTVTDDKGAKDSEVVYIVVNPNPADLIDKIPTKRKKIIIEQ